MRTLVACALLALVAGTARGQEPPKRGVAVSIALVGSARANTPLDVVIRFTNEGAEDAVVVQPITRCEQPGRRLVHYAWVVTDGRGKVVKMPVTPYYHWRDADPPVVAEDMLVLAPGKHRELSVLHAQGLAAPRLPGPGTYLVSLTYAANPLAPDKGGRPDEKALKLLARVKPVDLLSPPITVVIAP